VPLLVFAVGWLLLCPFALALHTVVRLPLANVRPEQRSTLLLAVALLPLVVAAAAALLAFLPFDTTTLARYCGAASACEPLGTLYRSGHAAVVGAAAFVAAATALWMWIERAQRRTVGAAFGGADARSGAAMSYEVVESGARFAETVGLLQPRLRVSRGLLEGVPPARVAVILAHETAHARRRDRLRLLAATLALAPLPVLPRPLLRELETANAEACDERAAAAHGRDAVIETLNALAVAAPASRRLESIAARVLVLALAPRWRLPAIVLPLAILGVYTLLALPAIDAARLLAELMRSALA
jgi:hypothetical protein